MNMEAYNLDSLRRLVRSLQNENKRLKQQLDKANIPYDTENVFVEKIENTQEYDLDQGGRIQNQLITRELANRYFSMFWGRTDVYAKRGTKGGYFPQCNNRWDNRLCPKQRGEKQSCEVCAHREWTKLTPEKLMNHLIGMKEDGSDVLGVYPLLADGTCRFLVFDFDNHEKGAEQTDFANVDEEWHEEVDALRMMCELNGITPLVERSRSGRGAHVWIFFKKPISASLARNFGFLLLDKGSASINLKSFRYYDRMYPSQDAASGIGNLIALPLQGRALKNGNSAFVDNSDKENLTIKQSLKEVSKDESLILVATGQKIGEGFDYPRLDTLMLAAPVSFEGRLEQYIGRPNRDYEGKEAVIVYDYIDSHIQVFDNMYAKRLRTYKRTGFELITNGVLAKQNVNAIYDSGRYMDVFEQDIVESEKKIIVSSPGITEDKVNRFLYLVKARQEAGCKVMVITTEPQNIAYGSPEFCQKLINTMRESGIHVILKENVEEHFAVLDDELVWHGGMNLLGKEDVWDNLMRVRSAQIAAELLEIALKEE